jgi:hypothetical protein
MSGILDYFANDPYGKDPQPYVHVAIEKMKELGAVYLEASYSGGNDEGGISSLDVFKDADGNDVAPPPQFVDTGKKHTRPDGVEFTDYEFDPTGLWGALEDILATKYGSWAGDFEAYGTLTIDVKEGRAWSEGQTTTYVAEDDTVEVEF